MTSMGCVSSPRILPSRRALLTSAGVFLTNVFPGFAQTTVTTSSAGISWTGVRRSAEAMVARESPSGVLPFEVPLREILLKSSKRVFFHYFSPFPLSYHNDPPATDHYTTQYLKRSGENDKYASVGGYLRERPLPVQPWQSPYWVQLNFAIEILRARATGADGFAVDILRLPGNSGWANERMLFETASAITSDFWCVPEPECSAPVYQSRSVQAALVDLASFSAAYRLPDGRLLVTPFRAEAYPLKFWQSVMDEMAARRVPIAFLPVFLAPRANAAIYGSIAYGISSWGYRDTRDLATGGQQDQLVQYLSKLTPIWMQPVVPQDVRPKVSHIIGKLKIRLFSAHHGKKRLRKMPAMSKS